MMQKNVASQKLALFAFDYSTGAPKTGDSANITAYVSKDHGAVTVLADTTATEADATNAKGVYLFDLAQGETNADFLSFTAKSSTANVSIVPRFVQTIAPNTNLTSIDSNGRLDVIKLAGTTQTARDIGASVLLSSGTGTGQLDFTSGVVKANAVQLLGTAWLTPGTAGTPDVNVKLWNSLATVALPLCPTVAGRTLDVSAGGEAGLDWSNIGSPTTSVALSGTSVLVTSGTGTGQIDVTSGIVKADLTKIKTYALVETAGQIAYAFQTFFNVASPTGTVNSLPNAVPGAVNGILIAGSNSPTTFSTLDVTGTLTTGGLTVGGAVSVTGATTLTGAVTASNASNNIVGIDVAKLSGDATAADNAEAFFDGTGYAGTNNVIPTVTTLTNKTGFSLASTGLDSVLVDTKTLPAALQYIAAGVAGKVSGAGTSTEVFVGLDGTTTRLTVTADASGNRTAVTYG